MDVLIIPCPNCENELRLPDLSLLGRFARCPDCRHKFVLEDPQDRLTETGEFLPLDEGGSLQEITQTPDASETMPLASAGSVPQGDSAKRKVPQIIGRYRVEKELGQGGMGAVYLAFDTQLQRKVALKVPKFSAEDGPRPIERFYREARLAATLSHPSICPVYDIGEADGTRYIAMAYIQGRPLTDYIRRGKPQPLKYIAKTICRVALALQEAHDRGVLHRDLKPDNIMIDQYRKPVIMDFGLARDLFQQGEERLTHSGALVGSPAYMSPEQVEGDASRISASSDIYSLGVVLYELLTGLRPFRGYIGVVMGQILRDDPEPPSELRPDIDSQLESICLKMMAKRPEDRFASMDQVAYALAEYVRGSESEAGSETPPPTIELPAFRPEAVAELNEGPRQELEKQKKRAKRLRREHRDDEAARVLKSMAAVDDRDLADFAEWARRQLVDLKEKRKPARSADPNRAACRTARKLIDNYDYEHAVQLLRQIPKPDRDEKVKRLLDESMELRTQVKTLRADISRAKRNRDFFDMDRKLQRLLELNPGDRKARQFLAELHQKSQRRLAPESTIDRGAAEWVLGAGGSVDLLIGGKVKKYTGSVGGLPPADFQVVSVNLIGCALVSDVDLKQISGLNLLESLTLARTGITDAGVKHLAGLRNLTFLDVYDTGLSDKGAARLAKALPGCQINY